MSEVPVEPGAIPDYGWQQAAGEPSHAYLDAVVLREVARLRATMRDAPRIFDAGCGNGALLQSLRFSARELGGCDASASGVRIAREQLPDAQIEHASVCDDLVGKFGTGWDIVVSTEVIEHLYAPRDFVREARRLLRPGGSLLLSTPYHGYLKNLLVAVTGRFDQHVTALWDGGHIKFWSYRTLRTLLAEQGFGEFRFAGAGRAPWLWKSMVVTATLGRTPR